MTTLEIIQNQRGRTLPKGWRLTKLGEVTTVVNGTTPASGRPEYWNGDIAWITPIDLGKLEERSIIDSDRRISRAGFESCNLTLVPSGSVVLSSRAPIGHLGIAAVPLCTNQGCKSFIPGPEVDSDFLYYSLKRSVWALKQLGSGATFAEVSKAQLEKHEVPLPPIAEQKRIAVTLNELMAVVEKARAATQSRLEAALTLPTSFARETIHSASTRRRLLGECLIEVRNGVGADWTKYPVLGATRVGLAPAKEAVGKAPERYKLVDPVTVFYNPMRILLGSIAMVDEGDSTGITSPDYVVVKGRPGILDTRWFYYWFRSAEGAHLIETLSRGAVRERILFNRLATGEIDIPDYEAQCHASDRIQHVRPLIQKINNELETINALPAALLRRAFNGELFSGPKKE